ncbi:MAG: hypothetical protein KDI05_02870 [Halieaceae bacterium]|nr:hypothetical protein [Halieaceae bacterium]MCP5204964.1 hypothetical protein [Pseudomonadales bacterium]
MSAAVQVGELLQDYAGRGVFGAFSRRETRGGNGEYRLRWHRGQLFQVHWNQRRQTLRLPCVLPAVPAGSPMYRELKAWLRARQDGALPDHRRCAPDKVGISTYNRDGEVALTLQVRDGDVEYATRRLLALVNEIYLDFLSSGLYYDWLLETFDLDPDNPH